MFSKSTDVRIVNAKQHHLPVQMRVPLKFGAESVDSVTCLRVEVTVEDKDGRRATGWGETPMLVTWTWPSNTMTFAERYEVVKDFCDQLAEAWSKLEVTGHAIEIGHHFIENVMPELLDAFNQQRSVSDESQLLPHLAALVSTSAFDIAAHDAFGKLHDVDIYKTYNAQYMSHDLAHFFAEEPDAKERFGGKYPQDFLVKSAPDTLPVWHLVGGLDPLEDSELSGDEPDDGYPVTLRQWIKRDGLKCLKVKLRGTDAEWDYDRMVKVGRMALEFGVEALSADFNCTVHDPEYVNAILDRLKAEHSEIDSLILYVEQPFPYDLEAFRIDVSSVSKRKPLFLDESAHDWRFVRLGQQLGWTGVALKTCKTQTGALLSLCWAKSHGMPLMVQDLTNPMLAQIPHVRLAAHAGTIMGVESNGMQFYPDASLPEAEVHPTIYRREHGILDLSTLSGPGFGYRVEEIARELPST
ncbi:hypothetical protein Pla22_46140 [Rubripirellula amarantea]|uniref:Enolase C-terminal domain-containing protein n=2 Tax=Rubripirellula amarantea TaxID=2527999 RepID=A0A5C5WF94_9BACT|nr:hypothetical protein Pla22_46140 [Rubripirellula amarantea]